MKRRYTQIAEKAITSPAIPQSGMQSIFYDNNDLGHPNRIDPTGTIWPVGGIRKIDEGGQIGWTIAVSRTNKGTIGVDALDFTLQSAETNVGATGDYSIAIGVDPTAPYDNSISIGRHIEGIRGIAIGSYNDANVTNLLEVGNGINDGARSNCLVVDANGIGILPLANVTNITNPKDIVTLEKLDAVVAANIDYDEHTFAIRGTIAVVTYPGMFPYVPFGRSKKLMGMRYTCASGICKVTIMERTIGVDTLIAHFTDIDVTSASYGQVILTDEQDFHTIVDNRMIALRIVSTESAEDLSVTLYFKNE